MSRKQCGFCEKMKATQIKWTKDVEITNYVMEDHLIPETSQSPWRLKGSTGKTQGTQK